jgi:hypothetical protein
MRRYKTTFFDMLPYRGASSITDRSIALINEALADDAVTLEAFYERLFLLSPQPDHPLNGDRLHANLDRLGLAARDALFGIATYWCLEEDHSSAARLARWAAAGPYPQYDDGTVELAAIPLVWLFSSPNRFMRDWITKALVQLLRGHPSVVLRLLQRFKSVNDPYVWERVVTVSYGCVMRTTAPALQAAWLPVVGFVKEQVFGDLPAFMPDAMMLDSARGVVEWAVAHGLAANDALQLARPPYDLPRPPRQAMSEKRIREKYLKADEKRPPEQGYGDLYLSLMSMGDFGRYVVESALDQFTNVPLSEPAPERPEPSAPKRTVNQRMRRKFLASLTPEQLALIERPDAEDEAASLSALAQSLTTDQWSLHRAAFTTRHRKPRERQPKSGLYKRWIFGRAIALGWTPARFGHFDRYVNYRDMREAHKPERFGKKYQWIAYHDLLARVPNYFHADWLYDELRPYDGPYQLMDREIDPSDPPIPFATRFPRDEDADLRLTRDESQTSGAIVLPTSFSVDLRAAEVDPDGFVSSDQDVPTALDATDLRWENDSSWVVLDGFVRTSVGGDLMKDDGKFDQYALVRSFLVPTATAEAAARSAWDQVGRNNFNALEDSHGHIDCCYLGELGWRETLCYHAHPRGVAFDPEVDPGISFIRTTEEYTWEGSRFDCSIADTVKVNTPSMFLTKTARLRWSGADSSWLADGAAVIHDLELDDHRHVLVAQAAWLRAMLDQNGLSLLVYCRGERRRLKANWRDATPWLEFRSLATVTGSGQPTEVFNEATTEQPYRR